jgi:serine protease Do
MVLSNRVLRVAAVCSALLTSGSIEAAEQAKRVELVGFGSSYLGVSLDEVAKDEVSRLKLAEERGALVRSVEEGSPAQKAGLKADDVIVRFQGEPVHTARQLARLVGEQPGGRTVSIEVSRAGATQRLQATLESHGSRAWNFDLPDIASFKFDRDFLLDVPEPPEPPTPGAAPRPPRAPLAPFGKFSFNLGGQRKLGIEYQEVDGQLAKYFKLADDRGVLVTHVDEDGAAGKAGMRAGDLVLKVAGRSVKDGQDLREEIRRAEPGSELGLSVQRDGKPVEIKLKLAAPETRRRRGLST